jgi:Abi-like protein
VSYNRSFETAFSLARFGTYRAIARNDDHAWELYRWNLALVAALTPLHADLEVVVRNAIDTQLAMHFNRADWWASNDLVLDDDTTRALSKVVAKHQRNVVAGKVGPGRVIADLTLGTWVSLLSKGGRSSLGRAVDYETHLWRPALRHGFSNGLRNPTRDDVHRRLALYRDLRNRCAHHEPIFDGVRTPGSSTGTPKTALANVWEQALEVVDWISPELAQHHRSHHDLTGVLNSRPT